MGIVIESLDVEIGIGCLEVEHIVLRLAEPVFPANVPTLNQHLVETMLGGKVDVTTHIVVVGTMQSVGLGGGVVKMVELDGGEVEGI